MIIFYTWINTYCFQNRIALIGYQKFLIDSKELKIIADGDARNAIDKFCWKKKSEQSLMYFTSLSNHYLKINITILLFCREVLLDI